MDQQGMTPQQWQHLQMQAQMKQNMAKAGGPGGPQGMPGQPGMQGGPMSSPHPHPSGGMVQSVPTLSAAEPMTEIKQENLKLPSELGSGIDGDESMNS